MVCGSLSLPNKDEEMIHRTIYDTIKKEDKGFIAWLKNGRLTVDTDVLAQLLNPSLNLWCVMTPRGVAQGQVNVPLNSFEQRRHLEQPPERKPGFGGEIKNLQQQRVSLPAETRAKTKQGSVMGKMVLKSKLRFGNISFELADLKFLSPEFREIPEHIVQHLKTYKHVAESNVKVMLVPSHNKQVVYVGDQEIEMADNDLILLKTRVRNGLVSFHEDDVEVRYPADWQVPEGILEDLKRKASNGKLFIISDEKGNLRCTVKNVVKDTVVGVRDMVLAWIWPF